MSRRLPNLLAFKTLSDFKTTKIAKDPKKKQNTADKKFDISEMYRQDAFVTRITLSFPQTKNRFNNNL